MATRYRGEPDFRTVHSLFESKRAAPKSKLPKSLSSETASGKVDRVSSEPLSPVMTGTAKIKHASEPHLTTSFDDHLSS